MEPNIFYYHFGSLGFIEKINLTINFLKIVLKIQSYFFIFISKILYVLRLLNLLKAMLFSYFIPILINMNTYFYFLGIKKGHLFSVLMAYAEPVINYRPHSLNK